ncbi:NADH dehydrogenase I chain K [Tolypothrix sp. PCC 7601]|nr:NADH dehydrogenase I chain K [Tolypothrix sp. PCC 7601]
MLVIPLLCKISLLPEEATIKLLIQLKRKLQNISAKKLAVSQYTYLNNFSIKRKINRFGK